MRLRSHILSDAALLRRVPEDPEAFGEFYDRYERPLLAFLRRSSGSADLAADLAGEVFAAFLAQVLEGRVPAEPRPYLYAIARNKVAESYRKGVVEQAARDRLLMEPVELTDEALSRIEQLGGETQVALAALGELPEEQRVAVSARVIEGIDYDDIAERLGCSNAVVRKRVSRGLAALRDALESEVTR